MKTFISVLGVLIFISNSAFGDENLQSILDKFRTDFRLRTHNQ